VTPSSRSLNTDEFEHDSPRIHHRQAIEPAAAAFLLVKAVAE